MRMAGPDIVLFVIGAVLFGGASFAIVQQGGFEALSEPTSALGTFTVTFATQRQEVASQDVASFRSVSEAFEVNATRVSTLYLVIDCSDGQGAAVAGFTLQVRLEGPGNVTPAEATASCGTGIELPVNVARVPADTVAAGATESEARESLPQNPNATRAVGTWTVTITGARSAGPVPVPGQAPVPDPSGSIRLEAEQWAPNFAPVQR